LTIEAACDRDRQKIAEIRNRLLAEHLDATVETVAARIADTGSIVKALDMLSGGPRSLRRYRIASMRIGARRVWGTFLIDPSRPLRLLDPLRQLVLRAVSRGRPSH